MASEIYIPTPPTIKAGPFITIYKKIAGNEYLRVVPGVMKGIPQVWRLHEARLQVATDATVADRHLQINNYTFGAYGVSNELSYIKGDDVPASSSGYLTFNSRSFTSGTFTADGEHVGDPNFLIIGNGYVHISVGTGKTGDIFKIMAVFEYMNRKLGIPTPYDIEGEGG